MRGGDTRFFSVVAARNSLIVLPVQPENARGVTDGHRVELFTEITDMGFRLNRIEVRETDTSVVAYTREDWVNDGRYFAQPAIAAAAF